MKNEFTTCFEQEFTTYSYGVEFGVVRKLVKYVEFLVSRNSNMMVLKSALNLLKTTLLCTHLYVIFLLSNTVVNGQGRQKITQKNRCRNFREIIFCAVKKRIFKSIPRIWHLPNGDLPKMIIIQQPSDEPTRGLR
jgi:hypothetical protein